jgi:hypothetical protein
MTTFKDRINWVEGARLPADISISQRKVTVRFHRRAHLPIVLASKDDNLYLRMARSLANAAGRKSVRYSCRPLLLYVGYETRGIGPFTVVPPPPDRELSDALNEFRDVHGFRLNHFQIAKPQDRASDVYTWWIISVTDAYDMIKAWGDLPLCADIPFKKEDAVAESFPVHESHETPNNGAAAAEKETAAVGRNCFPGTAAAAAGAGRFELSTPSPPNWKSAVTETLTASSAAANQDGCEPAQPSFTLVRQSRPRFIFAVHCWSVHAILDPAKQDAS